MGRVRRLQHDGEWGWRRCPRNVCEEKKRKRRRRGGAVRRKRKEEVHRVSSCWQSGVMQVMARFAVLHLMVHMHALFIVSSSSAIGSDVLRAVL